MWIAQLSLLALVVWAFAVYRAGMLRLTFDWVDGAVLLVVPGTHTGALVVVATSGDKRARPQHALGMVRRGGDILSDAAGC